MEKLKETILCAVKRNIDSFEKTHNPPYTLDPIIAFKNLQMKFIPVYKTIVTKPKYFWQKESTMEVYDYTTLGVYYGDFKIILSEEEGKEVIDLYNESVKIRKEIKQKEQLKELETLCEFTTL
jgi:hypothetical protein